MNAQSRRQGDRRPNGKPQTLPSSTAVPSREAVSCGARSPPAICRIADTTTERTSLSSLLAPESQPRCAHAPPARPTALSRPPQSERTAQTETPPWSPSLPALGHRPLKRGMDAPDAYSRKANAGSSDFNFRLNFCVQFRLQLFNSHPKIIVDRDFPTNDFEADRQCVASF